MPDRLDQIGWRDGASICDSQLRVLYYQRTPKGRVMFGRGSGDVAFRGDFGASFNRSRQHGSGNIRELHRVYPALRGVPIEYVGITGKAAEDRHRLFGLPSGSRSRCRS